MNPVLSVVVCNYNREELLRGCLQSLVEQTLDKERYQVIVVENNSTPAARAIAKSFEAREPNFRLVSEKEQGLSHARNRGWREACGEYVAFLDDDAKASSSWCERVVEAFSVPEPPTAVGGEIRPFYDAPPPRWFVDDFEIRSWGDTARYLQKPRAKLGFSGSNMAFPRSVLEEFNGFSPELGMKGGATAMGEETELFSRIYRKSPRFWYDPRMLVYHWTPQRSMTVSYRLYRSFKGGESFAIMQRRRILSGAYLLTLLSAVYFVAVTPFTLAFGKRPLLSRLVGRGEEFAGRAGFLFGSVEPQKEQGVSDAEGR